MKTIKHLVIVISFLWIAVANISAIGLEKRDYKVFIILDTIDTWSVDIRDGIKATLNSKLNAQGARAIYTEFDTKVDPAEVPAIIKAIKAGKPDIILMAVYPDGFADTQIAAKLPQKEYRFVSADPIPVQTGLIKSWEQPGGNITGVGVFLQFNSQLRLAKSINPTYKKLVFYSWNAMSQLNTWFELEIRKACKEEGVELAEFRRIESFDEEKKILSEIDKRSNEYFIMGGISAFIDSNGNPVDANSLQPKYYRESIRKLMVLAYDETSIRQGGAFAGAVVIWTDIGAQLAEKAIAILEGANPGTIPWSYPRKYNLVINRQVAKDKGIEIPSNLLGAAYRVYTDYLGNFIGKK